MTAEASARGRSNRVKGATGERDVAKWLRPYYPDACRAVRNTDPDPGDIACTSPGLWWSVKNCKVEQINPWMAEMDVKAVGRIGLLIVKRAGCADPGRWWCWMLLGHLLGLRENVPGWAPDSPLNDAVRLELRTVMPLLVAANYAQNPVAA